MLFVSGASLVITQPSPVLGAVKSSSRPRCQGRLSRNRTSDVHIRLFGTAGYDSVGRPGVDLAVSQASVSWAGATICSCIFL